MPLSDDATTTGGEAGRFLTPFSSFLDDDDITKGGEAGCTKLRFCTNTCCEQNPPQGYKDSVEN